MNDECDKLISSHFSARGLHFWFVSQSANLGAKVDSDCRLLVTFQTCTNVGHINKSVLFKNVTHPEVQIYLSSNEKTETVSFDYFCNLTVKH